MVLGLHALGFFLLFALVAPHHYRLGASGAFVVGTGVTAYTLGLRHAFDADHISAIDNTTRKLMAEGKRPLSVGFFFSLGHSTIVFVLAFLFALGIKALAGRCRTTARSCTASPAGSERASRATFLYVIAALNIVVLLGIVKVFREMRGGEYDEAALERAAGLPRPDEPLLRPLPRAVTKPWQMYPIGVLFGLGFDTASEVALLFLAGGAAGAGLPFDAILCLPILFAAGMSLLDTIDGSFMNFAYGWAFSKPVRKIFYNITITGLSVMVALVIGTIELGGIAAETPERARGVLALAGEHRHQRARLRIAGTFVLTWAVALGAGTSARSSGAGGWRHRVRGVRLSARRRRVAELDGVAQPLHVLSSSSMSPAASSLRGARRSGPGISRIRCERAAATRALSARATPCLAATLGDRRIGCRAWSGRR